MVDKNSPLTWTYDDFESLSVEVINHLTRRKLGKDFTFVSLSKWFTKFIVNYIVNNNHMLSKMFDVYNTIEISFKRDSGSLGTMTIVVKGEVKWRRKNNSKGTNFFCERMDIGRGICKKCLASVKNTPFEGVVNCSWIVQNSWFFYLNAWFRISNYVLQSL